VYVPDWAKWVLIMGIWQLNAPPNQIVVAELMMAKGVTNAWKGHIETYENIHRDQ